MSDNLQLDLFQEEIPEPEKKDPYWKPELLEDPKYKDIPIW